MLIKPKYFNIQAIAPPSKSESLRALIIAMLLKSKTLISNISFCNDSLSAMKILTSSVAKLEINQNDICIDSTNFSFPKNINCGESAFLFRTMIAASVLLFGNNYFIGTHTLKNRLFNDIENFLRTNKIKFSSNNSYLPFEISSKVDSDIIDLDASQSSQLLSGLLISNALCDMPKTIVCNNLVSKGYVDLTLNFLKAIGVEYSNSNYTYTLIQQNIIADNQIDVTGDWSGSAFLFVAAAIAGEAYIDGLDINSKQPDRAIIDVLNMCGANISVTNNIVKVEKNELKAFSFDATDCPDLFPPLVALAINCDGESTIYGATRLLNKESNRLKTLTDEFVRVGAAIIQFEDKIVVRGKKIKGGTASSREDHRIAMALSVAALNSINGIEIENSSVVNKSFPNFFEYGFL